MAAFGLGVALTVAPLDLAAGAAFPFVAGADLPFAGAAAAFPLACVVAFPFVGAAAFLGAVFF